jgi:SAM-dependent methyltransferase
MAPARRLRLAAVLEAVECRTEPDRPLRVCDAGCGDGLLTLAIAQRHPAWAVVGLDVRDDLLSGARERARARALHNVRFEHGDLVEPFFEKDFDVVLAIECLSEIRDDAAALRMMAAALTPSGWLVAHVPERSWRPVLPRSATTWREEVRHGYSADELVMRLRRVGFQEVELTPQLRGTATVAQELRDRLKSGALGIRAAIYPAMLAAVRLERLGLTWGPPRALLAVAVRANRPAS